MSSLQWILIAIICGTIEIFSAGFWFLWLAISAVLVALGITLGWLLILESQLLVFAIFTLLFIIFTRPLVLRLIKTHDTASNVKALIGQQGMTLSSISPLQYGQVKVNGEIWTAVSEEEIKNNTRVIVIDINGVKLLVKKSDD
jgi:membrane protein implicated in regulation of membrane protease activity